jgi:23S rRNA pseudouridine1911/1915/1917 synthase
MTRLVVTPAAEGARLDVYLAEATALSRRAARRLLADGLVWRNGTAMRVQSRTVSFGDVVDVLRPPAEVGAPPEPALPHPVVLHHDGWLLAAAKPAGVLTAPAERMAPDELALDQQVLLALALEEGRRPFVRTVHRLDRSTSGVVLFARRAEALPRLSQSWAEGGVERVYLAVVEGVPELDRTLIDAPIARDQAHAWRFTIAAHGRPARTEAKVVARLDSGLSLLACRLGSGRTHQVRVHLASAGHPVLGDRLYGSRRADEVGRALLHAWWVALPHPQTGDRLQVLCPPPDDLRPYMPEGLGPEDV